MNSWYEIDKLVESHNSTLKKLLKAKCDSTLILDYLFEYCTLNTDFFASLTKQIESFYSMNHNSKYLKKSAECDIRVIAQCLSCSRSVTMHSGQMVKYEATDISEVGVICLGGRTIANINRMAYSTDYDYLEGDKDELDDEDEDEDNEINKEVGQFFVPDHVDKE